MPPRSFSSDDTSRARRGPGGRSVAILAAACAAAVTAAPAHAAPASGSSGGGSSFAAKPEVLAVKCVRDCASRRRAKIGSKLRITGKSLDVVTQVVFLGSRGRRDDVVAPARPGRADRLDVRVPAGAAAGRVAVFSAGGDRSRSRRSVPILPGPPPEVAAKLSTVPGTGAGNVPRIETGINRLKGYFGGRSVVFSYRVGAPVTVRIELVNAVGAVVRTWGPLPGTPGQIQKVRWRGGLPLGLAAPAGRYSFRLIALRSSGIVARSAQVPAQRDTFVLHDHIFPVRGRHDYGEEGARFGAGRGGRGHQGHDIFARCGARVAAARGGRVKHTGYHGAAGNYMVIDGNGIGTDYAYMHLTDPSPFQEGDRVYTGQKIGNVGDSGNAHGCHLHFEMWAAPGWYSGGDAFDPLPYLQAWDAWS